VLSKCANPACSAVFRFLHQGRIFSLVRRPRSQSEPPPTSWEDGPSSAVERYWLCDRCARVMTVICERGAVVVKALPGVAPVAPQRQRPLPPGERTLAA